MRIGLSVVVIATATMSEKGRSTCAKADGGNRALLIYIAARGRVPVLREGSMSVHE